jgi:hypothetical protein
MTTDPLYFYRTTFIAPRSSTKGRSAYHSEPSQCGVKCLILAQSGFLSLRLRPVNENETREVRAAPLLGQRNARTIANNELRHRRIRLASLCCSLPARSVWFFRDPRDRILQVAEKSPDS